MFAVDKLLSTAFFTVMRKTLHPAGSVAQETWMFCSDLPYLLWTCPELLSNTGSVSREWQEPWGWKRPQPVCCFTERKKTLASLLLCRRKTQFENNASWKIHSLSLRQHYPKQSPPAVISGLESAPVFSGKLSGQFCVCTPVYNTSDCWASPQALILSSPYQPVLGTDKDFLISLQLDSGSSVSLLHEASPWLYLSVLVESSLNRNPAELVMQKSLILGISSPFIAYRPGALQQQAYRVGLDRNLTLDLLFS